MVGLISPFASSRPGRHSFEIIAVYFDNLSGSADKGLMSLLLSIARADCAFSISVADEGVSLAAVIFASGCFTPLMMGSDCSSSVLDELLEDSSDVKRVYQYPTTQIDISNKQDTAVRLLMKLLCFEDDLTTTMWCVLAAMRRREGDYYGEEEGR